MRIYTCWHLLFYRWHWSTHYWNDFIQDSCDNTEFRTWAWSSTYLHPLSPEAQLTMVSSWLQKVIVPSSCGVNKLSVQSDYSVGITSALLYPVQVITRQLLLCNVRSFIACEWTWQFAWTICFSWRWGEAGTTTIPSLPEQVRVDRWFWMLDSFCNLLYTSHPALVLGQFCLYGSFSCNSQLSGSLISLLEH